MLYSIAHFVSIIRCLALGKLPLLIFICLWASCKGIQDDERLQIDTLGDSVSVYLDKATDKTLPLNLRRKTIDRALSLVEKNLNDTLLPVVLYRKNLIHFSAGEYDSLLRYPEKLIDIVPQHRNDSILAEQYYLMGYYFNEVAQSDSEAVSYYTKSKDHLDLGILKDLASGMTKKEVSEKLKGNNITPHSESTIDKKISKLFDEFGARNTII